MRRGCGVLIGVLAVAACGGKKVNSAAEAARIAAETRAFAELRVTDGCYDCLLEAKASYEKLAGLQGRPSVVVRLFEIEMMLVLRERELAMDSTASLARARALAKELPPEVDAARYIAMVEAMPTDISGIPVSRDAAFRRTQQAFAASVEEQIAWLSTDTALQLPVRQYLSVALDCAYGRRRVPGRPPTMPLASQMPADMAPMVSYIVGSCAGVKAPVLLSLRERVPRYAEAAYYLARMHVSEAPDTGGTAARPFLAEAYGRFPKSSSITYLNGNFQQLIGDCREALRFYDETLALEPVHDNAMLGRTVCFAFLKQFDEAIASATRMIEVKSVNEPYALYWRAWVRHVRTELVEARADIERAKSMLSSNDIHRLAGIIEYDQNDLDIATKDLVIAKNMQGGSADCVSRWYLGLVEMKREKWPVSGQHFEDAMACYEAQTIVAQQGLQRMEARENIDPEFKARQIANFQAAIKEDMSQHYASAFNAANHYLRGGDTKKARTLLEVAAKDATLATGVAQLRKILDGGGGTTRPGF
jgi:tetratricopeptide (TPR) repeat protein